MGFAFDGIVPDVWAAHRAVCTARTSGTIARRARRRGLLRPAEGAPAGREVSTHEQLAILRRELNGLVAAWHHRTGAPHSATHTALRRELGGPAAAVASADQLAQRIDRIRDWARGA